MMSKRWAILSYLAFFVYLQGESALAETPSPPEIAKAEFSGNSLTFDFNRAMLTWVGTSAPVGVSIEPELPCKWSWSNDSQLTCDTPYSAPGVKPATRYHIAIRGGLWSQDGLEIRQRTLDVESTLPRIASADVDAWKDGDPVIEVWTNLPVAEADLRNTIDLTGDGLPMGFSLSEHTVSYGGPHTHWRVRPATAGHHPNGMLVLREKAGLRAIGGELPGNETKELLRAVINETFHLRRANCSGDPRHGTQAYAATPIGGVESHLSLRCPAGENVELEFSDVLQPISLEAMRKELPSGWHLGKVGVASYWNSRDETRRRPGYSVRIIADRANENFSLEIPATLRSEAMQIDRGVSVALSSTDFLSDVKVNRNVTGGRNVGTRRITPDLNELAQPIDCRWAVYSVNPHKFKSLRAEIPKFRVSRPTLEYSGNCCGGLQPIARGVSLATQGRLFYSVNGHRSFLIIS